VGGIGERVRALSAINAKSLVTNMTPETNMQTLTQTLTQTLADHVNALVAGTKWPDPKVVRAIAAYGAQAIEPLRQIVREDKDGWPLTFAVKLLALLNPPEVIPDLADAYRRFEGDELLDLLYVPAGSWGEGVIAPMLKMGQDRSLDFYTRSMAFETMLVGADGDPGLIAECSSELRAILAGFLADLDGMSDEEQELVNYIAIDLAKLQDAQAHDLLEAAFEANLINPGVTGANSVSKLYQCYNEKIQTFDRNWIDAYSHQYDETRHVHLDLIKAHALAPTLVPSEFGLVFPNQLELQPLTTLVTISGRLEAAHTAAKHARWVQAEQARQAELAQQTKQAQSDQQAEVAAVVKPTRPKVGRNDPCYCGSGKKYKYCHMELDR